VTCAITEKGYSQRRTCHLMEIDPRVHRYRSSRPDDAGLRSRLREFSVEWLRFGYRRLHILLERERWDVTGRSSSASTGRSGWQCISVAGACVSLWVCARASRKPSES
jgi:hypothetical protein